MKRWFLTFLIALPAAAEPRMEFCWEPCRLSSEGTGGSFSRMTNPKTDGGSLNYYRGLQEAEAERGSAERRAELGAPRTNVTVEQNTVVLQRVGKRPHRGDRHHGPKRLHHGRR